MPKDVVVRAQALDGPWQTIGAERSGIWPENVVLEADAWGSSRASFALHRDPLSVWPDLGAFTPVDVNVGGKLVWSGRVAETPAQVADHVLNVQCEGWQFHLDDDVYERTYTFSDLTQFIDTRSIVTAGLNTHRAMFTVSGSGVDGAIVLTWPNAAPGVVGTAAGVTLDLGPDSACWPSTGWFSVETSNNTPVAALYLIGHDSPYWGTDTIGTTRDDYVSGIAINTVTAANTYTTTNARAHRYVTMLLYITGAGTPAADIWIRLKAMILATSASYISAGASALKASTVVADAVARAAPLISTDTSGITVTTFNIPALVTQGPQTARQVMEAVNAYHAWCLQVDVNRRVTFKPMPSAAAYEVGAWSAMTDEDASQNSGEEIYDRALVTGTDQLGAPVRASRTQTPTLTTRRGFRRTKVLPVNNVLPSDLTAANAIGDTWLPGHRSTPFRGTLTVTGDGAVRETMTGAPVAPEILLTKTCELVRFTDRANPDDGSWSRDGRIVGAVYTADADSVQLTIDNSRTSFEALIARTQFIRG